jgi:hypothetical protein
MVERMVVLKVEMMVALKVDQLEPEECYYGVRDRDDKISIKC